MKFYIIKIKHILKYISTAFSVYSIRSIECLPNLYLGQVSLWSFQVYFCFPLFITPVGSFAINTIFIVLSFFIPVLIFEFLYIVNNYCQKDSIINQFTSVEGLKITSVSDSLNTEVSIDALEKLIYIKKLEHSSIIDKQHIFNGRLKSFSFKFYEPKEKELTYLIKKLELIVQERKQLDSAIVK